MKHAYTFYYEIYDGTKGNQTFILTLEELEQMCLKFDDDCDLVWWDYEFVG